MIDIESELYDTIKTHVQAQTGYSNVYFTSVYEPAPSAFPCAYGEEVSNSIARENQDSSLTEKFAIVSYKWEVFSNKSSGKKAECKAIADLIDEKMIALGFTRDSSSPIPNLADATIYRMRLIYTAKVDSNKVIYRR